jgi:hypothetical protein
VGQGPCFSSHFRVVPPRGGAGATRVTLGGWVPACLALQEDRAQVMSTAPVAVAAAAVGLVQLGAGCPAILPGRLVPALVLGQLHQRLWCLRPC